MTHETNPCTIGVRELHQLLTDLARTAHTYDDLPVLNGVLLHTATHNDELVLVGTSTDRFKLGQAHTPVGGLLERTFLPLASIKRALAILKPGRGARPEAVLARTGDRLVITTDEITLRIEANDGKGFPKVERLLDAPRESTPERLRWNPVHVRVFAAIAKAHNQPMFVESRGEVKPAVVYIGERYRGLLMPLRPEENETPSAPAFTPPPLSPEPEDETDSRKKPKRKAVA